MKLCLAIGMLVLIVFKSKSMFLLQVKNSALLNTLYKDSESSCGRVMHLKEWLGSLPIKD